MADKEEITFNELLEEKRHKEIVSLLKQRNQSDIKIDAILNKAIEKNTEAVSSFLERIGNIKIEVPKIDAPNVTVNNNNDQLIGEVKKMGETLNSSITELKACFEKYLDKEPAEYEFKIIRSDGGAINKIVATPKK